MEVVGRLRQAGVTVYDVGTGKEALALARKRPVDCVILDVTLPDMTGFKLLEHFRRSPRMSQVPVIVYTAADLSPSDRAALGRSTSGVIVKGGERAAKRLFERVSRFLSQDGEAQVQELLPDGGARAAASPSSPAEPVAGSGALAGRTVLVVDDDVRNVFALTALLERHGLNVVPAEAGHEAIEALESERQIDVVLLDVMMPDVDGYETMRRIRSQPRFADLPIIALTAKAMKGDRERCLEAGASDYIAKPIESTQLLAMLRAHLKVS
jgi:CheY-like chemotaxis protein